MVAVIGWRKEEDGAIDTIVAVLIAVRWIHFLSLFLLFGSSVFWIHMGEEAWMGAVSRLPDTLAKIDRLARVLGPVVALSGLAWLIGSIANVTGELVSVFDPETLHAFFFETSFGPLALVRLLLLGAIIASIVVRIETRSRVLVLGALSGVLLVSQAWLGHAAEDGGTLYGASMLLSYAVHVLAGAAWLGGLVPLVSAVRERARVEAITEGVLPLLMRFSIMAFLAVTAVVMTGLANSAFRIGMPTVAMASGPYARILLVKTGLVAAMLTVAGVNRFVLMPALARLPPGSVPRAVVTSIVAESLVGILVLGAAAVLGITPPRVEMNSKASHVRDVTRS